MRVLSRGIVLVYLLLFLTLLGKVGPQDQDQFLVFHQLQYWNSTFFGMAKQWTPLLCGGLSLAGEPQVPFMSLSMALAYVLGPFWALKAATVLYFIAGWAGAYLYAGLWVRQPEPRFLAASLFIGNGFFICRFGYGHIDFIPFLTLPLLLWMLHRVTDPPLAGAEAHGPVQSAIVLALLGAIMALAIDGSPVAIIHLLFWVGLYAAALAWVRRSLWPAAYFVGAVSIAAILDAGYLWPMLQAQSAFPRATADKFTSFLSLIWFAILPMRGKVLPANGLGHELSVYIGPILAWLLWRDRAWLRANLPEALRVPLFFVACVSVILGMGSLRGLHVPHLLSPFDILRPLPGFRSLGVTGRFWGFLALPLSLCSAVVLWRMATQSAPTRRFHLLLAATIVLQLGFQLETGLAYWLPSRSYHSENLTRRPFQDGPQNIRYVARGKHLQGEFITPTQAVLDCYDMDDFQHAAVEPGTALVKAARIGADVLLAPNSFSGQFAGWSHIILSRAPDISESPVRPSAERLRLVLNQAYHPYWQATDCTTEAADTGNLVVNCPVESFKNGSVHLRFNDKLSTVAASVSLVTWQAWGWSLALLLFVRVGGWRSHLDPAEIADRLNEPFDR